MRLADCHAHTFWSPDGKMSMREALDACLELGMDEITFTEHFDPKSPEEDWNVRDWDAYFYEIEQMRSAFPEVSVRSGVEVGAHSQNLEFCADLVRQYPFDYVLASVHTFPDIPVVSSQGYEKLGREGFLPAYFDEMLRVVTGLESFDALGHLDFPMRFHPLDENDLLACADAIESVLRVLVTRKKALEVNTRFVQMAGRPHPAVWVLRRFWELGGKTLVFGSDAHEVGGLAADFDAAVYWAREAGFHEAASYENRQPRYYQIGG